MFVQPSYEFELNDAVLICVLCITINCSFVYMYIVIRAALYYLQVLVKCDYLDYLDINVETSCLHPPIEIFPNSGNLESFSMFPQYNT